MYIVPQNYEVDFKNYIKSKINLITDKISNDLLENIFDFSNDKYLKIVSTLETSIRTAILTIIKETIIFFDEKFRDSQERKASYHINIRADERTLKTIFGDIYITRTYYETKDREEHFYFIDTMLGLEKYDRYDAIYKSKVIDMAIKTNQKLGGEIVGAEVSTIEENITNKIDNNIVPRQTIYSWIRRWILPTIDYPPIETDSKNLYVMADEKYIHEQIHNELTEEEKDKHHFIMSKCFVCFTGITQKGKRRILDNRMVFMTSSTTPWNDFLDFVTKVYDFEKFENIVFLSDAGKWLLSGAKDLKIYSHNKIIFCLCEFHARQKINRITTDEETRKELNKCIDENNKKAFIEKMALIKEERKDDENKLKKLNEYENYIVNHWNKIQNMFKSECRSSMESHISHCIASHFSSRPKAYSRTNIEKLLKLQEAKMNGINIQALYLKSYNNTEIIKIQKEELNFSIFETNSSSNLPIIENGNNNSLLQALLGLSYGNSYI